VSTRSLQRVGTAGLAVLTMVGLLSGCSAKKKTAASSTAAPSSAAAAAGSAAAAAAGASGAAASAIASAAASVPSPTKVKATGGGKFCQQVANATNTQLAQAAIASGPAGLKEEAQRVQALEAQILQEAPSSLKADIATVFGATNTFYAALAKANYDYTKVDPTALTAMSTPAVQAAEAHLETYTKTVCGIDTGGASAAAAS
jgi:hypothetical protein